MKSGSLYTLESRNILARFWIMEFDKAPVRLLFLRRP